MVEDYIPMFTHGETDPEVDISLLLQAYFKEWDFQIKCDPKIDPCAAFLQRTDYNMKHAVIVINPKSIQRKSSEYEERKKEVMLSLFHEVLHIDPDFDPRRLSDIASQMNLDFGNQRCKRIFNFLVKRFASTWHIENYLDECAEKVYNNKEGNKYWIDNIYKQYDLERIVNWKEDTQQREFRFMN